MIVIDGGAGYGQVMAKEAMDIGIERARKHGVAVVGLKNSHHIGRVGHWAEQCAWAGLVSTHWVDVHRHKSLVAPFGGAEPRFAHQSLHRFIERAREGTAIVDEDHSRREQFDDRTQFAEVARHQRISRRDRRVGNADIHRRESEHRLLNVVAGQRHDRLFSGEPARSSAAPIRLTSESACA